MTDVAALYGLRLRTPRLELRLGTHQELEALARVAERGIHPPGEMPFQVAWTDAIGTADFVGGFVAFHVEALDVWMPERWTLNLLAFHDGTPVGTQSVGADRFAQQRVVETGSWLGGAHQGRGLGTEMRAAVLELAFGHLAARAAESAWLESGRGQSARVSARLGYVETGTGFASPRGAPVVRHNVRLERSGWRCPFPVAAEGVEPCLALFGAG